MITRCNQCGTKFEISAELVHAEDPTVRCGECMTVFNARTQLVADSDNVPVLTRSVPARVASEPVSTRVAENAFAATAPDLETADTMAFEPAYQDDAEEFVPRRSAASAEVSSPQLRKPDLDFNPAYSDRVDPIISSLDDDELSKSMEFEQTLALDGLTGIEPVYAGSAARGGENQSGANQRPVYKQDSRDWPLQDDFDDVSRSYAQDTQHYNLPGDDPHQHRGSTRQQAVQYPGPSEGITPAGIHARDSAPGDRARFGEYPNSDRYDSFRATEAVSRDVSSDGVNAVPERAGFADSGPRIDPVTGLPAIAVGHEAPHISDDAVGEATPAAYRGGSSNADSAQEIQQHIRSNGGAIYLDTEQVAGEVEEAGSRWFLSIIGLLLLACAGLYLARDYIATIGLPQPVLSAFCSVTGCELPVQKDLSSLEIMRRKMYSHPTLDDVLVISVDVLNKAPFPQTYPTFVVTMANGDGESVAYRKFAPLEYQSQDALGSTLPSGRPVRVNFDIVDPGADAQSFELEFE